MTTTLGNVNQGGSMDRLVECPLCKGQGRLWGTRGCPICTNGLVKQRNLDRAREPLPEFTWSEAALLRLWRMVVGPGQARRERTRQQRAWLADNEPESRLDRLDREHREKREADDAG